MQKTIDVLLIDDSDADSKITAAAVRNAAPAASLVRVKDGEQALRLIFFKGLFTVEPHTPRLVLLELNVPRRTAHQLLEGLRRDTDRQRVPVVVFTACRDRSALEEVYELGARECLVKAGDAHAYHGQVASAVQRYLR
jgi:response regulator RpfG family c-di-GMP phosphodiesterase